MTPCSSNCAYCQRHTDNVHSLQQRHTEHVQSLQQWALDELNFYRKLLQLDPLSSMDVFESSTEVAINEPGPRNGSITRSAVLETMPPEILDRIAQFVDTDSILPLCHAMPYFKYISAAMFDFADRFPDDYYKPSELWPDMHLPEAQAPDELETTAFPIQHLHAAGVYSRIVSKHNGNGAFPDVLTVKDGDNC